ncbi:hypothetical protein DFH29DRAFT_997048 [Suillus ampliporus]|nr:hypothetical protein DFH29DRAFT_997048 [Suillus ampliporus]
MGDPSTDIHASITGHYGEDPFFKWVLNEPVAFKNFEVSNDLIFLKDNDTRVLCIPDIKISERRLREIIISHAHSILAHLGPSKTLTYLHENTWWKDIANDVKTFCSLEEWSVSCVINHNGQGTNSLFEIEYTTGDKVWLPYHEVSRLEVVGQYLEALSIPGIQHLPKKTLLTSPNIEVATVGTFLEAKDLVSSVVQQLIASLPDTLHPDSSDPVSFKERARPQEPSSSSTYLMQPSDSLSNNSMVISTAISSSSATPLTVVHTPSTPGDQGSDVLDIISTVEQEDLGLTLPPPKMTEAELFGRAVVFGLLMIMYSLSSYY